MVAEHDRRLLVLPGELVAKPGELFGGERAGIAAASGLVVGVETDHPEAAELATEVGRLVSWEEVIVEAVVALPLADTTRRVRLTGMRAIVVASHDEVVAAILAEPPEQRPRSAEVDRRGFGRDVAGGEQERCTQRARVMDERLEHHLRIGRQAGSLLDPDDPCASEEPGCRLAHVEVVAERDGEQEAARRRLG